MDLLKIIQKIKKGDQLAFRQLVDLQQFYAFKLAFRIVCNEEDARDVVQESFIKIWRNIKNYQSSVKFTTWMYKIVTNTAIDQYRKNSKNKTISIEEAGNSFSEADDISGNKNHDNRELARLIQQIAERLPEKQRMVFVLRDIQGFGSVEVQEILELSETVVKSNLYHARKAVKEKLSKLMAYERRLI